MKDGEIGMPYEALEKGFEFLCKFCSKDGMGSEKLFGDFSMARGGYCKDESPT